MYEYIYKNLDGWLFRVQTRKVASLKQTSYQLMFLQSKFFIFIFIIVQIKICENIQFDKKISDISLVVGKKDTDLYLEW